MEDAVPARKLQVKDRPEARDDSSPESVRSDERPSASRGTAGGGDEVGAAELGRRVADNLRQKRKARGMSLDDLARSSGVSRAALSQVETCKSNPTVGLLWKIAVGLSVPFAELIGESTGTISVLRRSASQILRSLDGKLESRPL